MNQNHNKSKLITYYPIMLAAMLVIGIYLGSFYTDSTSKGNFLLPKSTNSPDKISQIISFIDNSYVDSVERSKLIEIAIRAILDELDPHTYYISAEELKAYTEPLEGNFEGIGVEFLIQNDTVRVVAAIDGGPSASLGITAGDKIVKVDGEIVAGVNISNENVVKKLKGPGGTKVIVEVMRRNESIQFEITRGTIPINSISTSLMLDDTRGYIKLSRFARNTYEEFMQHIEKLEEQGMKEIIIDLRNNGGGYLNAAVSIAEEFLQKGQLIVYTEGKSSPRKSYYAEKKGKYVYFPVAIMINEASASASEILAGAIQDNDRGLIVGRRSFGKGLVQEHLSLRDQSALRLTVARYYTPSGRSIQKPYGGEIDYDDDFGYRLEHGELMSIDSVHFVDSLKYTTPGGKIVYGGGGIMPDIFVGLDTAGASAYLAKVSYEGLINQFGFDYADAYREQLLKKYATYKDFQKNFTIADSEFQSFIALAETAGIARDEYGIHRSENVLKIRIKAYIARNIWGNDGFYSIMNTDDNVLRETLISLGDQTDESSVSTAIRR